MNLRLYIFLFIFLIVFAGCSRKQGLQKEESITIQQEPLVLILYASDDPDSRGITHHLSQAFDYVKIPVELVDLSIIRKTIELKPSFRVIYSTTSSTEKISDTEYEKILKFIASGGEFIQTVITWDERFHFILGIAPDAKLDINSNAKGWIFRKQILTGVSDGFEFKTEVMPPHGGFTRNNFSHEVSVIASALNQRDYIALSKKKIGRGQVYFFNSTIMNDKLYRGLLFSLSLPALEGYPYPVANVSTIFLDDFPAAMYNAMMNPIDKEFQVDQAEFVCKIWWPDMVHLADSLNLAYTAMTCFNYNDLVTPPFDFDQWYNAKIEVNGEIVEASPWIARQVMQSRHELAFHGYNHISLWKQDWPDMDYILPAIFAVRKQWYRDELGPLPVTYVPPTNWIDSTGLRLLKKGLPSIKYMCSLYLGDIEEGGDREFDYDPYEPLFFDVPRITSGFIPTNDSYFLQESVYILSGIWTHFIHPDDVFFENKYDRSIFKARNFLKLWWKNTPGKGYGLYQVFRDWLIRLQKNHPLIRYKPMRDAAPLIINWRDLQVTYQIKEDTLEVTCFPGKEAAEADRTFFLYVSRRNRSTIEAIIGKIAAEYGSTPVWDGYIIEFRTKKNLLRFPLLHSTEMNVSGKTQYSKVLNEYQKFMKISRGDEEKDQFNLKYWFRKYLNNHVSKPIEDIMIKKSIESNQLEIAIRILEQRLLKTEKWNANDANQLIELLYWNHQQLKIWEILHERMKKYPGESTVALKKLIESKVEKPDWFDDYKWFTFEYQNSHNPDSVLIHYIKANDSKETYSDIKPLFLKRADAQSISDSAFVFIFQRMLWYDRPDSVAAFISRVSERYYALLNRFSKTIAQLYAYELHDYSRAYIWSLRDSTYNLKEQLDWLFAQKRYADVFELIKARERRLKQNDTLVIWLANSLIEEGFIEEGLGMLKEKTLERTVKANITDRVTEQVKYTSKSRQKKFLKNYPGFIRKSVKDSLDYKFRWGENPQTNLESFFHEDNFNNRSFGGVFNFAFGQEWNWKKHIGLKYMNITTGTGTSTQENTLKGITFALSRKIEEQNRELYGGLSIYSDLKDTWLPGYHFSYSFGNFTSLNFMAKPVESAPAIQDNILRFDQSIYHERTLIRNILSTSLYAATTYYTDRNFQYETNLSAFFRKPAVEKTSLFIQLAIVYQDATRVIPGGLPYWTPDQLWTTSAGITGIFRRRYSRFYLNTSLKYERESKWYGEASANWILPLGHSWKLTGSGYFSTSKLYRYNELRLGIHYAF